MDPLAGLIGALVIANWSFGLLRDTGSILLDRTPDPRMAEKVRTTIESEGDQVTDLHLWRLGPGHLGAIVAVATSGATRGGALPAETGEIRRSVARHRRGPALPFGNWPDCTGRVATRHRYFAISLKSLSAAGPFEPDALNDRSRLWLM